LVVSVAGEPEVGPGSSPASAGAEVEKATSTTSSSAIAAIGETVITTLCASVSVCAKAKPAMASSTRTSRIRFMIPTLLFVFRSPSRALFPLLPSQA
jgi:hypothetical protein